MKYLLSTQFPGCILNFQCYFNNVLLQKSGIVSFQPVTELEESKTGSGVRFFCLAYDTGVLRWINEFGGGLGREEKGVSGNGSEAACWVFMHHLGSVNCGWLCHRRRSVFINPFLSLVISLD